MRYLIAILMVLFASSSQAGGIMMMGGGVPDGAPPDPVLAASQTEHNNNTTYGMGQSFVVTQSGSLYSVVVRTGTVINNATNTVTCRISTNLDLSSGYLEEITYSNATTSADITLSSVTNPTLSTGTTYYLGCKSNLPFGDFTFHYQASNVYADGTEYYFAVSGWDLTGGQESADAYFKVYVQ